MSTDTLPPTPAREPENVDPDEHERALEAHGNRWLSNLLSRQQDNLDSLIAITGEEGVGKSTLALQLAYRFDEDLSTSQIHFDAPSFLADGGNREKGSTIILDEAFEGAFNRRSMSHESVGFVQFLGEARALEHTMIVCFPRWANLDDYLANHRVAYRIRVPSRGVAKVYEMKTNPFADAKTAYPVKRTAFSFGPFDEVKPDLWRSYMDKKLNRIRERTRSLGKGGPTGLTMGGIKNAAKTGHLSYDEAVEVLVHDGHVRDEWAAEVYLNAYLDEKSPDELPNLEDVDASSSYL